MLGAVVINGRRKFIRLDLLGADSMIWEEVRLRRRRPSSRLLIRSRRPSSTIIGEKIIEGTLPFGLQLGQFDEGVAEDPPVLLEDHSSVLPDGAWPGGLPDLRQGDPPSQRLHAPHREVLADPLRQERGGLEAQIGLAGLLALGRLPFGHRPPIGDVTGRPEHPARGPADDPDPVPERRATTRRSSRSSTTAVQYADRVAPPLTATSTSFGRPLLSRSRPPSAEPAFQATSAAMSDTRCSGAIWAIPRSVLVDLVVSVGDPAPERDQIVIVLAIAHVLELIFERLIVGIAEPGHQKEDDGDLPGPGEIGDRGVPHRQDRSTAQMAKAGWRSKSDT